MNVNLTAEQFVMLVNEYERYFDEWEALTGDMDRFAANFAANFDNWLAIRLKIRVVDDARMQRIALLSGLDVKVVQEFVEYDWTNKAEHDAWLEKVSDQEVADWIVACSR